MIRFGDTIFTIQRTDSVTAYLYRFLDLGVDSIKLDLVATPWLNANNANGDGALYFSPQELNGHVIELGNNSGGVFESKSLLLSSWDEINSIGVTFLKTKNINDSIAVFKGDQKKQMYSNFKDWVKYAK